MKATHKVGKLTEEGKALFSWQFDETQNMDDVRCVSDIKTGEIILAVRIPKEKANVIKVNPQHIVTEKSTWDLWYDGYEWNITRTGDNV